MTEWIRELIIEHGKTIPKELDALYAKSCEDMQKVLDENKMDWDHFDKMFERKHD